MYCANVPRPIDLPCEFCRSKNPCSRRNVGIIRTGDASLWGPTDPARIEERWHGKIEIPEIADATVTKIENRRSFNEERPLFLEVCFNVAQIYNRRIDLHLTEIRIDRPRERHTAAESNLHVHADIRRVFGAMMEWISGRIVKILRAGRNIRHDFHLVRWLDILHPYKVHES